MFEVLERRNYTQTTIDSYTSRGRGEAAAESDERLPGKIDDTASYAHAVELIVQQRCAGREGRAAEVCRYDQGTSDSRTTGWCYRKGGCRNR